MKRPNSNLIKSLVFTFLLSAGINLGTPTHSEAGWGSWFGCALAGPVGLGYCAYKESKGSGNNDGTVTLDQSPTTSGSTSQTHQYNPAHIVVFQKNQCKSSNSMRGTLLDCSKAIDFKKHNDLNRGLINTSAPGYVFFQETQCKFKSSWANNSVSCKKVLMRKSFSKFSR